MREALIAWRSLPAARRALAGAGLLTAVLLCGGCLSRPPLARQWFAFPPPARSQAPPTAAARVLEIHQVRIAPPFDSQSFIYRTGQFTYERDPYAEFLVPPAESLLPPLRGGLEASGLFRAVTSRGSALKADLMAEVYVHALYGDFRQPSRPKAVMRISFRFLYAKRNLPGASLWEREYEESVPFQARTAAGLMAAWNEAWQRMLGRLTADLKAAWKP